ncbi:hypothetical protein OG401_39315 [Kitasatospora purpeofusca]|uniref:hypothetical protein n=1 Tax=Kitasatospora purpeofusca TaxID=67352 RepID=UPI00225094B0|nr:hypothetical protein [Kitasatospora purpeofusca]MCX4690272.1 hypothetical protein [Kitasatospora purpeofusca]
MSGRDSGRPPRSPAKPPARSPTTLLLETDNIEALPHETPTLVLGLIYAGTTPYDAVTGLEQPEGLDDELTEHTGPDTDPEDTGLRLTPLDPKRPAPDLLEDLLAGIHGCRLLHEEYDEDVDEFDDEALGDGQVGQPHDRSRSHFAQLVRETAATHRDRLV